MNHECIYEYMEYGWVNSKLINKFWTVEWIMNDELINL